MTSRHPAVSCACPKCQSERRTTPPPATDEPWEGPLTDKENAMLEAAWQKHKDAAPPTPATDEREAVARAICALHCTECGYTFKCDDGWREVLPDADAALSALAPIRAQEIAAARAEEQGYRHTQVAALKQVHAAEILAAEARGMGRARTVVQNTRDGMKFDPSATLEWRNAITGGFNAADLALRHELDAIERNEHGAGK